MSEQPEPESRYAYDRDGRVCQRKIDVWLDADLNITSWEHLVEARGPMAPLLPAVRPEGVRDDAVPFVGWVSFSPASDGQVCTIWSPNGAHIAGVDSESAQEMGYPVPAAPAPSLPERLREAAERGSTPETERLLREAADALEAGSQP